MSDSTRAACISLCGVLASALIAAWVSTYNAGLQEQQFAENLAKERQHFGRTMDLEFQKHSDTIRAKIQELDQAYASRFYDQQLSAYKEFCEKLAEIMSTTDTNDEKYRKYYKLRMSRLFLFEHPDLTNTINELHNALIENKDRAFLNEKYYAIVRQCRILLRNPFASTHPNIGELPPGRPN